jgi:PAS domain S-box-containing protein
VGMQKALLIESIDAVGVDRVDELSALYRLTDRLYRARSAEDVYSAALDAIVGTLGCERASILLFDDDGVMNFVAWRGLSEHYRTTLRGHSPWKPGDRDPDPIFVSDIGDTTESAAVKATIVAEGIRALGFIPLVADGAVVGKFMTYYPQPRRFAQHEIELAVTIARQVGFSLERMRADAARRAAEAELRESEERFRLMSEHAPVMIWMSDPQGGCAHLNRMLRDFWGVDEEKITAFDWRTTMHPDDADAIVRQIGGALAARQSVTIVGRYMSTDGEYHVLETHARPRHAANGEFLGMIGVNIDVSERYRADAQRELLLAELNHRVKNTLAVVQSLAHQTFRNVDAPEEKAAFEGRLFALAAAHNLLTQSNWESAAVHDIARDSLLADGANAGRVHLAGPRVLLTPRAALAIALALHELGTNAVKYGALSNDSGCVSLTWQVAPGDPPMLRLEWREEGGPPVAPPARRGFGSILLERSLTHDLDGKVTTDFRRKGLVCTIEAPLTRRPSGIVSPGKA